MGEEDRHSLLQELELVEPRVTPCMMSKLKLLVDNCVYSGVISHNASKATDLELYIHCNHGFGANSSSFQPFLNELRRFPSISAVAHDTYGYYYSFTHSNTHLLSFSLTHSLTHLNHHNSFGFTVPVKATIPLEELSLINNGKKTTIRIMKHILGEQGYKQVNNVCLIGHSMVILHSLNHSLAQSITHSLNQSLIHSGVY